MVNDAKVVADVTINNCRLYQAQSGAQAINTTAPISQPVPSPINQQQRVRMQRTPDQLSEISKRIREKQKELNETSEEEISIQIENEDIKPQVIPFKKECKTCGQETKVSLICAGCGASICDGCAVESADDGKPYCEPCWDDL